jgi:L-fuconolactonase
MTPSLQRQKVAVQRLPSDPMSDRVDAHHHLWDLASGLYSWPTPAEPAIHRSFSAAELASELRAAGIDRTVIVQVTDSVDDTESMLSVASEHPWIAGVVGWISLTDRRSAERQFEAYRGRINGIRHLIHGEPDPEWLVHPEVRPGLDLLSEVGLPFDVVAVFPNHLKLVPVVAARHPDLVLVIDHLAKPPFRSEGWDQWMTELRQAAAYPNVRAKVSGLDTAAGPGWSVDELRPAWDVALEAFGPDRLMFGSDWPVCRLVSSYGDVVSATQALVSELSPSEQGRIMGISAVETYRLPAPSGMPAPPT